MSHLLYAYIATPTREQVAGFLRALQEHGITISHLGKNDPPRRFEGTIEEVLGVVFSGTDLTNHTFARSAAQRLDFDFQVRQDPRWTHSTVSASCDAVAPLLLLAQSAAAAFDSFVTIRGTSSGDKEQTWQVLHITERCPSELRVKFVTP